MKKTDYAFYSDIGGRQNNEDSLIVKQTPEGYLYVVADGLGGHMDGEIASRLAVDVIKEGIILNEYCDLCELVNKANAAVCQKQDETKSAMKTTIAVVVQHSYKTHIAHVGDTRVYAFKDGEIVFQTNDHSVSQMAVILGEIGPEEIRCHEDRNRLTRVVGLKDNFKVEIDKLPTESFDSLLICSDGFWEYVLEEDMKNARMGCHDAKSWLYKMRQIQLDNAPEQCDNNTAIAVIIEDK